MMNSQVGFWELCVCFYGCVNLMKGGYTLGTQVLHLTRRLLACFFYGMLLSLGTLPLLVIIALPRYTTQTPIHARPSPYQCVFTSSGALAFAAAASLLRVPFQRRRAVIYYAHA